ncbi:hypothetical protein KRX57_04710 [Weeksellaceae bacterium TAE3-ERU29]|nr:hypothetical protein [Weeksellaceae bacterium TAE3-ERU29]
MNKKSLKIGLGIVVVLIIGFLLNPFWWLMQSPIVQQPKWSEEETEYFERFTKNGEIDIIRYYKNFTKAGKDTLFVNDYDKRNFDYKLVFYGTQKNAYQSIILEKDSIEKMAKYIKYNILKNNKYFRNIIIRDGRNKYIFSANDSVFFINETSY